MTDDLFTLLEKNGIRDGATAVEVIDNLEYEPLLTLALECFSSVKQAPEPTGHKLFTFAPIASIAGGPSPCTNSLCRLEAAYSLSLIGALYADRLVLPNFFDYMFYMAYGDKRPPESDEEISNFAYTLAADIAVCFLYKPLFDAGIAVMNFTIPMACKDCHNKHLKESRQFHLELKKVLKDVEPNLNQKVKFVFDENDYISVVDDDNYLGGGLGWGARNKLLKALQKHSDSLPYTLSEPEIKKFGLRDKIIDDTVNDILEYDFYPSLNSATYLTNRQFDVDLIEGTKKRSGSSKLTSKFPVYHEVPYLEDILLEDVVALRLKEANAFQVYRDKVAELVRKDNESDAKEFFTSSVEPAIHKINNIISDNKARYRARAGRKIVTRSVIALAGVGAANFLGFPVTGAIGVAGAAGLLSSNDVIDDIQTSNEVPSEAKQNPHYFLWGIKNKHADKSKTSI